MRGAYLKPGHEDNHGARGGVGAGDGENYDLEIGNNQIADFKMVALCTLIDEIEEYLKKSDTPIGQMILRQWKENTKLLANDGRC